MNLKHIDLLKVSKSRAIRDSPKWILRAIALSMTEWGGFVILSGTQCSEVSKSKELKQ